MDRKIASAIRLWACIAPLEAQHKLRRVCKAFNEAVGLDAVPAMCKKLCTFDDTIYDDHYYNRQAAAVSLENEKAAYEDLRLPAIVSVYDEWLEENTDALGEIPMPYEYRCFMYYYLKCPNLHFTLLSAADLKSILNIYHDKLRDELAVNTLERRAYYVPLFYTRTYYSRKDDNFSGGVGAINIMCYVNLVIEHDNFPTNEERFIVLTAPVVAADDHDSIVAIIRRVVIERTETSVIEITDLADTVGSFINCMEALVNGL